MNKPGLQVKDKVATVYNSKGEVCETFSFRDHGNSYLSAAQNYLMQNYDKLMAEEVEQMDEGKWRDEKLKGKTFMNPRAVNLAPKDRSEYYGGDINNPGELRGFEKIPLNRKGKPELSTDPLADRAKLPKRTRGGQKFPRVGPLKQAIMNKEEVEQMDEVSRSLAGRYIGAASEKEEEERKKGKEFVQKMRDAGMKGIGTPLRHKGPHMGKSSREAMIKLAINKLTNPDFPVSDRVKVPATESVKIDEAYTVNLTKTKRRWDVKDDIGQPIHAVDRHYDIHDENGKKVGEVLHHYNQYGGHFYNGHIHGSNIPYDRQKITDLKQNAQAFINGVEKTKWHSKLLERTAKRQQKQQQKEEVEQIDEISQDLALRAHAKANDVTSRRWNDKFASADLADKGSQGMFYHSSSGEDAADQTAKRLRKHIKRKFGPEAAARAKRSEFGVVAPEHTTPKKKSFLSRLGLTKEGVEQMDEVAPPGREKQVKALKGKVDNPAETKSENTMYNNMLTKLEEGRGRPPKPGSEAWKRRQSAAAAGGAHVETPHIATQLMKHADYGFKNHTYKFSDGSTHEITPTQRDTVLRKLRSMTGPGKKPEDREKMYDEINTPAGFFHHTGDKPIASKKLHPMSAQKE